MAEVVVGHLAAKLRVDKGTYVKDMGDVKRVAADTGKAIAEGIGQGAEKIPGLMSSAARGAMSQLDQLASEARRATSILEGPAQQLAAVAKASGMSTDELRAQLVTTQSSARELGIELEKSGSAAAGMGDELEKSGRRGSRSLDDLAATAKRLLPALSIGAVIGAGWNRFTGIENAEMQLRGLGNTAQETSAIMDDALAAVKGTAFGLDEAVKAAATASAAGVQAGGELEKYLTLVGDLAAITNSSFDETAQAMNRAVTVGAAYNDTLRILAQRGLPVYSLLSKELQVTTGEVKKLAAEGKISADVLQNALASQVGGAALKMGETTTGQLKNVGAALSRVGADILSGIMPTVKGLADGVIVVADAFGKLPGPVKTATVAMAAFVALRKAGLFSSLASGAAGLVTQLKAVRTQGIAASGALSTLGKASAIGVAVVAIGEVTKAWGRQRSVLADVNSLVDINTGLLNDNAQASLRVALVDYADAFKAAGITVDELTSAVTNGGQELDGVIDRLGEFKKQTAAFNTGPIESVIAMFDGTNSVLEQTDELMHWLENTSKRLSDTQEVLGVKTSESAAASRELAAAAEAVTGRLGGSARSLAENARAAQEAAAAQREYYRALIDSGAVLGSAATAMGQWIRAQQEAAQAAANAAIEAQEATAAQVDSMVALHGAADDLGAAFGDFEGNLFAANGELDLSSAAVRGLVSDMRAYGDAAVAAATATAEQTGSLDAGRAVADQARAAFIDLMVSQGETRAEAERLAQQMGILDGIDIHNKTFTITAIDNASAVMSRIAQLASMLGIQSASSAGSAMADWLRKNPDQIGAAYRSAIADSVKITATPSSSGGGGRRGGGGGGASSAAKREREKAQREAEEAAEKAARRHEERMRILEARVTRAMGRIGKEAARPFDVAAMGIDVIERQIASAGRSLQEAVRRGLEPELVDPLRKELLGLSAEAGKQMWEIQQRIRTEGLTALRDSVDGSVTDMRSAMAGLVKDLQAVGASSSLIRRMTTIEGRLTHLMDQREAVTKRLADAQSELNRLMDQYKQRVDSVTASIQSYANITQVQATNSIGWISSVGDLIGQMGQQSSEIESFVDDIAKLRSMGLNESTLNQLIDAGPGQGWAQARLLAGATSDEIRRVNDLAQQVFGQGNRLGRMSADSMYSSGISAAQAMVNGLLAEQANLQTAIETLAGEAEVLTVADMELQGRAAADGLIVGLNSKKSELTKAMRRLGRDMVAEFKKAMEISSPSRVMAREVGAPMADGVLVGFERQIALGDRMTGALRSIAVPTLRGAVTAGGVGVAPAGQQTIKVVIQGGDEVADLFARTARIEIEDAEGRRVQVERQASFAAVRS